MEQTLRIGGIMLLDVAMRSSDRKLLIESCINFYAEKLNIKRKNFLLIAFTVKGLRKNENSNGFVANLKKKYLFMKFQT